MLARPWRRVRLLGGNMERTALTLQEAARSVGLSRRTILREIEDGRLASFKIRGRRLIRPQALEAWLRRAQKKAA
jgi:excisionase family DNA binding protein